jgi:hypothetical protein
MEAGRDADGQRGLVPDRFVVRLHPDDLATLVPPEAVARELASGALSFARARGYALRDRPRVTLQPEPALRPGEVDVDAELSPLPEPTAVEGSEVMDTGTRVFAVPIVRAPEVVIEVREPGKAPRRVSLTGAPMRIGRAPECELVLKDSRASRRHARLHARDGVLVLTDLGSTNGTRVNGHRVTELVLGAGDKILIGDTNLTVEAAPAGAGARS